MNEDKRSNWNYNKWNSKSSSGANRGGFSRGGHRGNWRGRKNSWGSQPRGSYGDLHGRGRHNEYGNRSQQWTNRPKRDTPSKRLSEEEIGVTEYISDHKGFFGIIKSRYSDFQVSEINEKGEVAKLTDLSPPAPVTEESFVEDEDLLLCKYNVEILPMETWDRINKLVVCEEASSESVEIDVTGMSKDQRTRIHEAVKKAFGDGIVGSTITQDEKKLVRFDKFRKGVRIDNRVKWSWPGEYVHFIVHKENCDTMDAAARIAERLRINLKPSMVGYAGTKDRRAKTSQWFTLRKVDPRRAASACRDLRDLRLGNYGFRDAPLRLGMLQGNRFRIALRNVSAPDEAVSAACLELREHGFVNYYGLQRFGSRADLPTYRIGLQLLQGNFKEAIEGILAEREGPLEHALHEYKLHGAAAALRAFPRRAPHANIEQRMLRALARCPTDLHAALNSLARNTRLLYLHSYQSLVWNRCASERLRRLPRHAAPGDLVPLQPVHDQEELSDDEESDNEGDSDSETQDGDEKTQDGGDKLKKETVEDIDRNQSKATVKTNEENKPILESSIKQEKQKIPVKVLTQQDVDSGKYSIFDLILPLPGSNIEYPPNMKEYYEELLTKDGLNLEMTHKIKSYSMSGAYRRLVARPYDATWHCVRYSDPHADLLLSDRDELEGRTLHGIIDDGKYKALLLTMSLPASCYATMALRELLKADTSCDHQASHNDYHKKNKQEEDNKIKAEETKPSEESQNKEKIEVKTETARDSAGDKRKIYSDSDSTELETKKLKKEDNNQ